MSFGDEVVAPVAHRPPNRGCGTFVVNAEGVDGRTRTCGTAQRQGGTIFYCSSCQSGIEPEWGNPNELVTWYHTDGSPPTVAPRGKDPRKIPLTIEQDAAPS
jgi:hypothetical protein